MDVRKENSQLLVCVKFITRSYRILYLYWKISRIKIFRYVKNTKRVNKRDLEQPSTKQMRVVIANSAYSVHMRVWSEGLTTQNFGVRKFPYICDFNKKNSSRNSKETGAIPSIYFSEQGNGYFLHQFSNFLRHRHSFYFKQTRIVT